MTTLAWNFDLDACPIDELVLLAAGTDWVREAVRFDSGFHWATGDRVHENLVPHAWARMPGFPAVPTRAEPQDEADELYETLVGEIRHFENYDEFFAPTEIPDLLIGCAAEITSLRDQRAEMLAALKGVLAVADRKTDEFDAARAAVAKAEGRQP